MKISQSIKSILAVVLIVALSAGITALPNNSVIIKILMLLPLIQVFNAIIMQQASSKSYLLSEANILTTKYRIERQFDLEENLLFEKFQEVLEVAGFTVKSIDNDKGELMAKAKMTWASFGENIYLEIKPNGTCTFISVALGMYAWGKNEKNLNKLLNEFDKSLTI